MELPDATGACRDAHAAAGRESAQPTPHVHTAFDTFSRDDIAALAPFFTANAIAHEYEGTNHVATHHGRAAILARLEDVTPGDWDGRGVRLQTMAVNGHLVATIGAWPATSRWPDLESLSRHVLVARVEGGHVTELWIMRDGLRQERGVAL